MLDKRTDDRRDAGRHAGGDIALTRGERKFGEIDVGTSELAKVDQIRRVHWAEVENAKVRRAGASQEPLTGWRPTCQLLKA